VCIRYQHPQIRSGGNLTDRSTDQLTNEQVQRKGNGVLSCEQYREAVSAQIDGEDTGVSGDVLGAHLRACRPCRDFATSLHRLDDVLPAADLTVPERSADILAAVRRDRAARSPSAVAGRVARAGLAVLAVAQMATALFELTAGTGAHSLRDLGAFQLALAVGFLVAAVRPTTAPGLLPTAAALALCLLAVVGLDIAAGQTTSAGEATHTTELLGVALVWLIARGHPARRRRRA
jgi:predicted anti-sigma-YlaC factor YlaD